jgi:hypothetical protein
MHANFHAVAATSRAVPDGDTAERWVLDFEGFVDTGPVPLLAGHDWDRVAGLAESVTADPGGKLLCKGVVHGDLPAGKSTLALASRGEKLHTSVNAAFEPDAVEHVTLGERAWVNSRWVYGPAKVVRAWRAKEVSVTRLPADRGTTFHIEGGTRMSTSHLPPPITAGTRYGVKSNVPDGRSDLQPGVSYGLRWAMPCDFTFDGEPADSVRAARLQTDEDVAAMLDEEAELVAEGERVRAWVRATIQQKIDELKQQQANDDFAAAMRDGAERRSARDAYWRDYDRRPPAVAADSVGMLPRNRHWDK